MDVLVLDQSLPVPPSEQVRAQIAAAIGDGRLAPAAPLPAVRRLAAGLGLAVSTVARAYRELEQAGLIETRGRNGCVVTGRRRRAQPAAMRASHADRDAVLAELRGHCQAGRLTLQEFGERSDQALRARTHGELAQLTFDLPAEPVALVRRETEAAAAPRRELQP